MHETFYRHDVIEAAKRTVVPAQIPIVCENCGRVLATLTNGWNESFSASIGVPGSPDLAAVSCDAGQHWACSIDCWELVGVACIHYHLRPTMEKAHALLEERRLAYEQSIKKGLEQNGNNPHTVSGSPTD
jgi:hypothetical protein